MAERRPSRSFEERIEVKPSIELIPDEFEHHAEDGSDIVIHAFTEHTEGDFKNVQQFFDALKSIGYSGFNHQPHNLERNDFLTVIKYSKYIFHFVKPTSPPDGSQYVRQFTMYSACYFRPARYLILKVAIHGTLAQRKRVFVHFPASPEI
nr:unnamed protein product [Callosobruchus chinensis]